MYPNLEDEMKKNKITGAMLARRLNKTPTTVSLKLHGKAPITLAECVEIKSAIGTDKTIDYLFETE